MKNSKLFFVALFATIMSAISFLWHVYENPTPCIECIPHIATLLITAWFAMYFRVNWNLYTTFKRLQKLQDYSSL